MPKYTYRKRTEHADVLTNGYRELLQVFKIIRRSFRMSVYLTGFFFMMMGLLAVFSFYDVMEKLVTVGGTFSISFHCFEGREGC
ncbi:MAG: hypothetical protein V1733_04875 [bacterium]